MRSILFLTLFVFVLSIFFFGGCSSQGSSNFSFVDINGEEVVPSEGVTVDDPIMIKVTDLNPDEFYRVSLTDASGDKVYFEDLIFISNGDGEIVNAPVIFLGGEVGDIVQERSLSKDSSSPYITSLKREVATGSWCVNVSEFRGGSVTGKRCIKVKDEGKRAYTTDLEGNSSKSFLFESGDVYLKGRSFAVGTNVDLYLIANSGSPIAEGSTLLDMRGVDPQEVTVDTAGAFFEEFWVDPSILGLFDIVIDVDQDGIFDLTDFVVSQGAIPGFAVQNKSAGSFQNTMQLACGEGGNSYCRYKNFFISEDIYSFIKSITQPLNTYDDPTVQIFILNHKDTWTNGEELTGVLETPIKHPVISGTYGSSKILAYPKGLITPGCYDLIIDTNLNFRYDYGQDFLDNSNFEEDTICGFSIPGGEGSPAVTITAMTDSEDQTIAQGGSTTSAAIKLEGTVTTGNSILAGFIEIDGESNFKQFGVTANSGIFDTGLFPLFDGDNKVTLYFMDENKLTGFASTTVNSDQSAITRDLQIELTWSIPTGATAHDLDLHFVKPSGEYFGSQDTNGIWKDCYWLNCKPGRVEDNIDWGNDDDINNNPVLEIDCSENCVRVENIYMDTLDVVGDYEIYVDAFNGEGTPTVKIYIDGVLDSTVTPDCTDLESGTANDSWHVGTITGSGAPVSVSFLADGTCDTVDNFQNP